MILGSQRIFNPRIMALRVPRTNWRPIASFFVGPLLAGLLLGVAATPARAQFNGPPGGVSTLEINRPVVITTDPAILYPPVRSATLLPGDLLKVTLYGDVGYDAATRIDRDGGAELPLLGRVHLAGLSVDQARALIAEQLVAMGMYRDPQVMVGVEDGPGQFITIFGETHGVVPVKGGTLHLLQVLAQAGGVPGSVSHVITIDRPGLAEPIVIDIGTDPMRSAQANIPVFAGDMIVTSRIGSVYVMGDFKSQGMVALNTYTPLTLIELTVLQGGVQWAGKKDQLHIIRTEGNRRVMSTFNVTKILNGTAPDPILQPNDIVYLPNSPIKSFFANGTLNSLLGYVSLVVSVAALR